MATFVPLLSLPFQLAQVFFKEIVCLHCLKAYTRRPLLRANTIDFDVKQPHLLENLGQTLKTVLRSQGLERIHEKQKQKRCVIHHPSWPTPSIPMCTHFP